MSEAGNDMKVAFSKEKGKEAIECSPTLATTPSQLLHPVSVTIPIGNREVRIILLLVSQILFGVCNSLQIRIANLLL